MITRSASIRGGLAGCVNARRGGGCIARLGLSTTFSSPFCSMSCRYKSTTSSSNNNNDNHHHHKPPSVSKVRAPTCDTSLIYKEEGAFDTHEWRGKFFAAPNATSKEGSGLIHAHGDSSVPALQQISPWHDLPRRWGGATSLPGAARSEEDDDIVCVIEIPQGSLGKLEMSKEEAFNPILQDTYTKKPGKPLRYLLYQPETGVPYHYGFIPRTYEDPKTPHPWTGLGGDGDPLDVVLLDPQHLLLPRRRRGGGGNEDKRLSSAEEQAGLRGSVWRARVLGVLPMIDSGETDWKIIAEPVQRLSGDPTRATTAAVAEPLYRDVGGVPAAQREAMLRWFRYYKTAEKKPENTFAMSGGFESAAVGRQVVAECGRQYDELLRATMAGEERGYWMPV